jgi:histidinol phosphatase-like enzyme
MALVILDRDGVINRDSPEFIKTPDGAFSTRTPCSASTAA